MSQRSPGMDEVHDQLLYAFIADRVGELHDRDSRVAVGENGRTASSRLADRHKGFAAGHLFRALELLYDQRAPAYVEPGVWLEVREAPAEPSPFHQVVAVDKIEAARSLVQGALSDGCRVLLVGARRDVSQISERCSAPAEKVGRDRALTVKTWADPAYGRQCDRLVVIGTIPPEFKQDTEKRMRHFLHRIEPGGDAWHVVDQRAPARSFNPAWHRETLDRSIDVANRRLGDALDATARPAGAAVWPEPGADGDIELPGDDLGPVMAELEVWAGCWFPRLLPLDANIPSMIEGLDCAEAANLLVHEFEFPRCTSLVLALARGCSPCQGRPEGGGK